MTHFLAAILLPLLQIQPVQPPPERLGFGDTLLASLTGAFAMLFAAVPRILGFIIIVAIGWFIANLIGKAVEKLLRAVRFNEMAQRTGIGPFVQKMRRDADTSAVVAGVVKWLIRVVVLLVAFDVLGLPAVSDVLRQFLLWLPNLIVALFILVIAGLAARALADVVRGATAEAGFTNPDTLANVAKTMVWAFAIVVAVNQIGIATALINTLFMGLVGALALAAGLAFGLGGRELASTLLDDWYGKAQDAKPKMRRAAASAADDAPYAADDIP